MILPILMKAIEPTIVKINGKSIDELKLEIVEKLHDFLDFCKTDYTGSKYSMMGPAGKLLNLVKTTGDIDWGKIKGYIANVIRSNQNWIASQALELLEEICDKLALISKHVQSPIQWLNLIEGIDYELFFQAFKTDRKQKDKYITDTFRKYLQNQFKDIDQVNKLAGSNFESFEEVSHPREFPNNEMVDEFWKNYKKEKQKKKEDKK